MSEFTVIAFVDPPEVIDCSVTPIPGSGSAPLQVVAAMPLEASAIHWTDGTGRWIGIYIGPPGSEKLKCIVGGGGNTTAHQKVPVGSRVSLRSMDSNSVASGGLCLQFMTR